jgi:hypothetical protein
VGRRSNVLGLCIMLWAVAPEISKPLQQPSPQRTAPGDTGPSEPAAPLQDRRDAEREPATTGIDRDGVAPLEDVPPATATTVAAPEVRAPYGRGRRQRTTSLDPKTTTIARLDLVVGPLWRVRPLDTLMLTSLEVGRTHGFSGSFHTGIIVASGRDLVKAIDLPIGVGAVARGRLRKRPIFGSIGLTAGLLVHRAATEAGVIRRVDPDFRVPIRFAWTLATVGLTVALEQGYSIRARSYDRRGAQVWGRSAYRVGLVVGLHSDFVVRPRKRPAKPHRP